MKITGIVNYGDGHISVGFDVAPQQAIDFFKSKGLSASFRFDDVLAEEHATAFTVAKMMDIDLLRDVQDSLQQAMETGMSFRDWADKLRPTLQSQGWWGRKAVTNPATGEVIVSELGSARRLETIFRTNMQSAYAAGQWQQIKAQQADAPYLMYDAVDDYRTRAQHAAWDNKVLPISSQWWDTHSPPNGYNCRCGVIQLDAQDVESMGLTVGRAPRSESHPWTNPRTGETEQIPAGVDPQFAHNPGKTRHEQLKKIAKEKISKLPKNMQAAASKGLAQAMMGPPTEIDTLTDRLKSMATVVLVRKTALTEGLRAFVDALDDVHQRFGLGDLSRVADYRDTEYSVHFPPDALAGYAPKADTMIYREGALDLAKSEMLDKQDLAQGYRFDMLIPALSGKISSDAEAAIVALGKMPLRHSIGNHPGVVAIHEYGHRLHAKYSTELDAIVKAGYYDGWAWVISQYAATKPEEFIAEAFALYITGTKADHARIYPDLLQAFRRLDSKP